MKFLILLLFIISCGKEEGAAIDYRDNDGDQIPNYLESEEFKKYVADVDPIGKVSGRISFNHKNGTILTFANKIDLKDDVLRFMAGRENSNSKDDYFSEWTKLQMESPQELQDLKLPYYTVNIHMQAQDAEPEELFLVNEKTFRKISNWDQHIKTEFSAQEIKNLASGKAFLSLQKKFYQSTYNDEDSELSIREKNNRLYLLEKNKSKVLYISKDLSFEEILKYLKISNVTPVEEEKLFFLEGAESKPQWFVRHFGNGDSVLAFTTIQDIRKEFIERFTYSKKNVVRNNGKPLPPLTIGNHPDSQIYLRLRATQTKRKFVTKTDRRRYIEGGAMHGNGGPYYCNHLMRNIKSEERFTPSLDEVLRNLNFLSEGKLIHEALDTNAQVNEKMDEKGIVWEIKMTDIKNLGFSMIPLPKTTFVTTGQYDVKCEEGMSPRGGSPAYSTNLEGQFIVQIESYVEKID